MKENEQSTLPPHVHEQPHVGDVREMNINPSAPASSQQTPVLTSHKRTREVDTFGTDSHVEDATLLVSHKRPREGDTGGADSHVHVSPPRPVEHVMEETSCPTTSVEAPVHVSPPRPVEHVMEEVETSCPPTSVEAPVHVSPPRHVVPVVEEVETSGPTTSLEAPVHVSPPRHVEPVVQELENGDHTTSLQTPKAFKLPSSSPGTLGSTPAAFNTRGFFDVGCSGDLPIQLADVLELDTATDKFLDSHRRGGKKGDLTRPLKERKTRWIFNHWWTGTFGESYGNFIWYGHTSGRKCVTYQPTHAHLWTLAVDRWLVDDIVKAYAELMAIREVPPDFNKTQEELDSMDKFIQQYQKQLHGKPIHLCDVAFFPVCTGSHWFMFVVDINKFQVKMIDPLRDEKPTNGREIYPLEFYVVEKFIPYMLFKLHPERFRPNRYMGVKEVSKHPKQLGGVDCGIYVCKYIDAILNGIDLAVVEWKPPLDVITFRYRIAHELKNEDARRMPQKSIDQRLKGV